MISAAASNLQINGGSDCFDLFQKSASRTDFLAYSAMKPMGVARNTIPAVIGHYRRLRLLGRGGGGDVCAAEDSRTGRRVAIKLIQPQRDSRSTWRKTLREVQLASRIHHSHVVAVYDVGAFAGGIYVVMELASRSVQSLVDNGPLPWQDATKIHIGACEGLKAVHASGVVHGDVKPANLLLSADGDVKITDFGLARCMTRGQKPSSLSLLAGTPHFMSPEQCRQEQLDERTDVYSLGVTYHFLLTGQTPYTGETASQIMFQHCSAPLPNPQNLLPTIPDACAEIVARAMAKRRADRYGSVGELQHAMRAVLSAMHCADDRRGRACSPRRRGMRRSQAWRI